MKSADLATTAAEIQGLIHHARNIIIFGAKDNIKVIIESLKKTDGDCTKY